MSHAAIPLIELDDVHKSFGAVEVLKGVGLTVQEGKAICIIGPSGSGKYTILRCINGLTPIDSGFIRVGAHRVHEIASERAMLPLRREVAMVFQQYNLFPHRTVLQNVVMAPVQVLREKSEIVTERAVRLLAKVRLTGKERAYPGELSGGQQQRVAIARALAMQPRVILFDEVTAALDPETVKEVLVTIRELAEEGMTCVLVTHEMRFAQEVADHVYFTDWGKIVEHGPPAQVFKAPQDPRTQEFLSKIL